MRVVVTGAHGQLGMEVVRVLASTGHEAIAAPRDQVAETIAGAAPERVIHCGAWTDVDGCEADPELALRANGEGTRLVVDAARACGAHVVYVSTDYVFDGEQLEPYVESDAPNPLSAYGRSKLAGEEALRPSDAVVRTSWVCGPAGKNIISAVVQLAAGTAPLRFATDQRSIPTLAADLAPMLVRVSDEERDGVWHITNQGAVSAYELAREVLRHIGADPNRVEPIEAKELGRPAPRPSNSVLASERLGAEEQLPDWRRSPSLAALLESNLRH
jgi:dTDP-4-dehydrorhamnose reductase